MRRISFGMIHVRRAAGPAVARLAARRSVASCRSRSAAAASGPTSAKATAARRAGRFRPVRLWWRADRLPRPRTSLPVRRIGPADAWCEDPTDRRYNRPFRRSANEPGDRLWRDDAPLRHFSRNRSQHAAPRRRPRQRRVHPRRPARLRADRRLRRAAAVTTFWHWSAGSRQRRESLIHC